MSLWPIRTRQGVVNAACSLTRDIGERKRSEARIDELAVVVESSQDAILIKTLDGQVTFWNAAAQRLYGYRAQEVVGRHIGWLYGYRAQEVVGRHIGLLIPPDLKDEEADLLERIGRGERIEHYETRRATSDGRVLDVDVPRP